MPELSGRSGRRASEQTPLLGNDRPGNDQPTQQHQPQPQPQPQRRRRRRRPSYASSYSSYGALGGEGDLESGVVLRQEAEEEEALTSWASSPESASAAAAAVARPPTPLPWKQLAVLAVMRVSEPTAFLCIMPFIPQMLEDNLPNVSKKEIGYYAGFIESVFALVQFATVFLWGRASDRIGRKPVLLFGLAGVFLSMNAFGLARTLPQMIIARSVSGLMGGNIGVLKSVMGEITDESNQARAFSYLPLCFGIGSMIGPFLGGTLSEPAKHFSIFRDSDFLKSYPYWLPCFAASLFALIGALTGFFFLSETLPSKAALAAAAAAASEPSGASGATPSEERSDEAAATPPALRDLLTTSVVRALANAAMINFVNVCYIAALPLFAYTPIESGGLSLSKQEIGAYLGANGIVTIVVQLAIFPRLERYLGGPLPTLQACLTLLPLVFVCFALAHFAGRELGHGAVWAALALLLICRGASSLMVVASNLCINNVVPVRSALGAVNGLSQSLACLARAVGPISANSAFAFSITRLHAIFDGQLVWVLFSAIALVTWYTSAQMTVPARAMWRTK